MLTVVTRAKSTALIQREAVKQLLQLTDDSRDAILDLLIPATSAAIVAFCHRPFAREVYSETVPGYGNQYLSLARYPVVALGTILDGYTTPITDAKLENGPAGLVYRAMGWLDTAPVGWALTSVRRPGYEEPWYTVGYTAGYLLPGDNIASAAVTVDGPSKQFRLTGGFPALVAGDVLVSGGFTTVANNGTFTVASATADAVTVSESTLVTEAASAGLKTLTGATLPADIQQAAFETVKAWYLSRAKDDTVAARTVGDLSIRYREPTSPEMAAAVPLTASLLLAPYVRMAA